MITISSTDDFLIFMELKGKRLIVNLHHSKDNVKKGYEYDQNAGPMQQLKSKFRNFSVLPANYYKYKTFDWKFDEEVLPMSPTISSSPKVESPSDDFMTIYELDQALEIPTSVSINHSALAEGEQPTHAGQIEKTVTLPDLPKTSFVCDSSAIPNAMLVNASVYVEDEQAKNTGVIGRPIVLPNVTETSPIPDSSAIPDMMSVKARLSVEDDKPTHTAVTRKSAAMTDQSDNSLVDVSSSTPDVSVKPSVNVKDDQPKHIEEIRETLALADRTISVVDGYSPIPDVSVKPSVNVEEAHQKHTKKTRNALLSGMLDISFDQSFDQDSTPIPSVMSLNTSVHAEDEQSIHTEAIGKPVVLPHVPIMYYIRNSSPIPDVMSVKTSVNVEDDQSKHTGAIQKTDTFADLLNVSLVDDSSIPDLISVNASVNVKDYQPKYKSAVRKTVTFAKLPNVPADDANLFAAVMPVKTNVYVGDGQPKLTEAIQKTIVRPDIPNISSTRDSQTNRDAFSINASVHIESDHPINTGTIQKTITLPDLPNISSVMPTDRDSIYFQTKTTIPSIWSIPLRPTHVKTLDNVDEHGSKQQPSQTQLQANPQIQAAVNTMISMGFSNAGNWLMLLLESVDGDISKALDKMHPSNHYSIQ